MNLRSLIPALDSGKPDFDLDIMKERQTLEGIAKRVLDALPDILDEVKPDIVLVHGDTSTAFISALSTYYRGYKVGHVEAGLRSHDRNMPEEINRILTDHISDFCFAPTQNEKDILLNFFYLQIV